MSDLLPADQIQRMTGYKRQADQLRELHRQGFYRARLSKVTREVILERPHYDSVCKGEGMAANDPGTPKLRKPKR